MIFLLFLFLMEKNYYSEFCFWRMTDLLRECIRWQDLKGQFLFFC